MILQQAENHFYDMEAENNTLYISNAKIAKAIFYLA